MWRLEWVKARKEAGVEWFHKRKRIWDDGTADEVNEDEDTSKKKPKQIKIEFVDSEDELNQFTEK